MIELGDADRLAEHAWHDLVEQVRRLVDQVATHDPDAAGAAFDGLVAVYGRRPAASPAECGARGVRPRRHATGLPAVPAHPTPTSPSC